MNLHSVFFKVSSSAMGALTSNRKRGDDYFKSLAPIDNYCYSNAHISKKPKISVVSTSWSRPMSSNSAVSRISQYPDTKCELKRIHAPVRNSRFGFFSNTPKFEARAGKENSGVLMGNMFAVLARVKKSAVKTLRYHTEEEEKFVAKANENEVIEIDDDGEEDEVVRDDVPGSDDSSIEEVDVVALKEGCGGRSLRDSKLRLREKEFRSVDSSLISDVSTPNVKVSDVRERMTLMQLDDKDDHSGVPRFRGLYDSTKKRDSVLDSLKFEIELNEKRCGFYRELRSQKKGGKVKKDLAEECFIPLTEEEEDDVARALSMSRSSRRKVLVCHENSNIDITGETLQCLRPTEWLNDEVINVYLGLLKEREMREPQKFLKCHFFSTFFYKKLNNPKGGYNYQSVRKWTTQRKLGYNLSECDKIFVPIHQNIHWCLGIINKKEEKFQYLDSLGGIDSEVLDILARYYVDEVKDKSGKEIDVSSWEQEFLEDLPRQRNGYDCGVFMIKYADFYSRNIGLCFSQDHMPYFRKRTAKEILKLRAE